MKKIFLIMLLVALNGCAVVMAAKGRPEANIEVVTKGAGGSVVENELGKPIDMKVLPNGNILKTYQYDTDNKPSVGRAVLHGVMDGVTFGLWEFLGTPLELTKGKIYRTEVEFDKNFKVIAIRSTQKLERKDLGIFPQVKSPD